MTRWAFTLLLIAAAAAGCQRAEAPAVTPPPSSGATATPSSASGQVRRLNPALDALVPVNAVVEKVAGGFQFTEGPLWRPDGTLWFSDVVGNVVRSVTPDGTVKVLIEHAGGASTAPAGSYVGPNGMAADKDGTVLLAQHFNRQIVRVASDLQTTVVVAKFEGKRLNSPNDVVLRSDGTLYITDPPFGLGKQDEDPEKQLNFNGVFKYGKGKLTAIVKDLSRPNGVAFSPDEKTLYISNADEKHKVLMQYDVASDGSISNARVFADLTAETAAGMPDGMKVDERGNVYATGPGGIWVLAPDGTRLGLIQVPEAPSNCAWGDDGRTLYITAVTSVYRVKLSIAGSGRWK